MSKKVSKNHHYVPKGVLRNFCVSGETILRMERTAGCDVPESKNIDKVFQRFHLNNFETDDGKKDDRVEKFFATELDDFIPGWIGLFTGAIHAGQLSFKSQSSKLRFIQFFYNHMKRTPDFVDPIVQKISDEVLHEDLAEEFEKKHHPLTNDERKMLNSQSWRQRVISNSRVKNFSRQSEDVLDILASMKILVATPKRNSKESGPVALSCRPMCSFKPPSVRKRQGFSSPVLSGGGADCRSR